MKIGHVNVRSLISNFASFRSLLDNHQYEYLGVTETWIRPDFDVDHLSIQEYNFHHIPRLGRGGGVAFYLKNCFSFTILLEEVTEVLEHIWIRVVSQDKSLIIGVIYRNQKSNFNIFLDNFEQILSNFVPVGDEIVCLGDFNNDLCNPVNNNNEKFYNLLNIYNLRQLISEPTRVSHASSTLIDYVITFEDAPLAGAGAVPVHDIADHHLVFCDINTGPTIFRPVTKTYRNFRYFDLDLFSEHLRNIPWYIIFDLPNVNDKMEFLNANILFLFDLYAPFTTRTFTKPATPWMTDNLRTLIKERNKAFYKSQNTRLGDDWARYKELRNFTSSVKKQEQKAYLRHLFLNKDSKLLWKNLKQLDVRSKAKTSSVPDYLSCPNDINKYFISVQKNSPVQPELLQFYSSNLLRNNMDAVEFSGVSEAEILQTIKSISSTAVGSDNLSLELIKYCLPIILPYVKHIINHCISASEFPDCWKESIVTPLAKIQKPKTFSDLRPVSVQPVLAKVFEKIILYQLNSHLTTNNIIPVNQSGFRKGHSTATALGSMVDDFLKSSDGGNITALVLIDYSKAFDTLNHQLLLSILHYIGLGPGAVVLLRNYLMGRTQRVKINNKLSEPLPIISGVPQGSILGPILFSIYTCRLPSALRHCRVHMYADDTQIFHSFSDSDLCNAVSNINDDLSSLYSFSEKHSLYINPDKSSSMLFGSVRTRRVVSDQIHLKINNCVVPQKDCIKILGLLVDSELTFSQHVRETCRAAYGVLRMLYSNRNIFDQTLKLYLCDTLVLSKFNYCDTVFSSCLVSADVKRIQRVQNACLRFVYGMSKRQHISPALSLSGWLNMAQRRFLHAACLFHKIINTAAPPYLYNKIKFRTDIHNINIRFKNVICIPKHKLELYKRSFTYQISKVYNVIPEAFKHLSLLGFKRKLKVELLNNRILI